MVKSLVSKLSTASNLSLAGTLGSGSQETNYLKHRNDPGRFFGDGVQFKAKLIGILEVGEARGDRMCQEALQDLKMAIRAAGEHKQRITIHVTIEGLRLRDEKTGDSLYHHPVHKISFIAQDMTDSRAFGYIFGSPDSGHRFFGIKTDKAASQVVLAMRDLFQVVFELKKKEIELARQQRQTKSLHEHQSHLASLSSLKSAVAASAGLGGVSSAHSELNAGASASNTLDMLGRLSSASGQASASSATSGRLGVNLDAKSSVTKELSPESVADLVDLEQELSSLQRGITQMERITPNDAGCAGPSTSHAAGLSGGKAVSEDDPFGDSFTNFTTYNILPPPPESGRTRNKPNKNSDNAGVSQIPSLLSPVLAASNSPAALQAADEEDNWLHELEQQNDVFDTSKTSSIGVMGMTALGSGGGVSVVPIAPLAPSESSSTPTQHLNEASVLADIELSSLGLSGASISEGTTTNTEPQKSDPVQATIVAAKLTPTSDDPVLLPRDTDPFSPTRKKSDPDPFQEGDLFSKLDAFEFEFGGAKNDADSTCQETTTIATGASTSTSVFNGPLQVQLPPESGVNPPPPPPSAHWKGDISRLERQMSECGPSSSARSRPTPSGPLAHAPPASVFKQQTVDVISSISTKKMPHLFGQARFSKRDSNSSVNMRRLQESDSLSETEAAPEPPPRPDSTPYSEPPPLPPKKQFNDIVIRPHTTVPLPTVTSGSRYEYLNNTTTTSSFRSQSNGRNTSEMHVPPIPLPSRRVGRSDGYFPGPSRPRKPGHTEDEYLAPITSTVGSGATGNDVPPLLPPPMSNRARTQRQQSKSQEIYENKAEIIQAQSAAAEAATLVPDITLTQLLTLGIDELAQKLNVPISKLSTMTLVELTAYLSEYLTSEKFKPSPKKTNNVSPILAAPGEPNTAVFKVNFDHHTSFVAKFDDTFGEDLIPPQQSFVANFANFHDKPTPPIQSSQGQVPVVPPADRYAVFREIIDQELQQHQQDTDLMGDLTPPPVQSDSEEAIGNESIDNGFLVSQEIPQPLPKIDTNITEVVAQAKDRYAALRDIILVENLFDKGPTPTNLAASEKDLMQDFPEFSDEFNEDQDIKQIMGERTNSTGPDRRGLVDSRGFPTEPSSSALTVDDDDEEEDAGAESSLDSNDKDAEPGSVQLLQDQYEKLSTSTQQLDAEKPEAIEPESSKSNILIKTEKQDSNFLTVTSAAGLGLSGSKDDLEIDELMQRAISNLSLDSRERTSPACASTAGSATVGTVTDIAPQSQRISTSNTLSAQAHFNDVSTSPIPQQKSPQPHHKSPLSKSPQVSPVPSQLSAVSQLIDTASKQVNVTPHDSDEVLKSGKESWAIFDSPKTEPPVIESRRGRNQALKPTTRNVATTLHLPPPPPSNTSQQDTAESPCSSDPRDDGWTKNVSSTGTGRRGWHNKERQQTSSSSRDLSPWDDDTPESYGKSRRLPPGMVAPPPPPVVTTTDRHGYYMRHARRMNSCDEDYDYEDDFSSRREHRKFKHDLSRSRDNFDLDSPSWYHHPAHNTWSPQDIEQGVRGRSFERSAYERTTYGPPIYDKRVNPNPAPGSSSYDRRVAAYDKRGKYYREYVRPNYDYAGEYGDSPPMQTYRGDMKISSGRRGTDYENVYDDGRSPLGYKSRGEYMYERERKSFDRESVESFESATRRRRSFGSGGDVYGSLDSRDDYRDRYLSGSNMDLKTRSLRKPSKLRVSGDIDYEQDLEHDFQHHQQHQRSNAQGRVESRSLQRPSQLSEIGSGGGSVTQTRIRKSSGSSPWDGEEPSLPGQKGWKRPASATETERRLAENRRTAGLVQTPSDGEKDRRFRKKTRTRSVKDLPVVNVSAQPSVTGIGARYAVPPSGIRMRDNYDYITCQDDEDIDDEEDYVDDEEYEEGPPADEDKFERLNRKRHEMHQRMLESERRQMHGTGFGKIPPPPLPVLKNVSGNAGGSDDKRYCGTVTPSVRGGNTDYGFVDSYEQTPTPRSNASSSGAVISTAGMGDANVSGGGKFNFDDGFESDFNQCASPPPVSAGTASSCNSTPATTVSGSAVNSAGGTTNSVKSFFRFSNDFSEREKLQQQLHQQQHQQQDYTLHQSQNFGNLESTAVAVPVSTTTPPITQKLRFDDNVKISQFDDAAFEDDFAKASFDFDKEDTSQRWQHQQGEQRTNNGNVASTSAMLPPSAVSKKQNLRTSKLQQRQELIKKSESVNIFAKKSEDPFEDDEFFTLPGELGAGDENNANNGTGTSKTSCEKPAAGNKQANNFQWDNDSNFAKFDENM